MKVNEEVAKAEVESWLDAKKISKAKRKEYEDGVDTLVSAVCDGVLSLNEDCSWGHELNFPISDDITTLRYKHRVSVKEMKRKTSKLKSAMDIDGRLVAIISLLTNQTTGVIEEMDSSDYSTAKAIALFFLN